MDNEAQKAQKQNSIARAMSRQPQTTYFFNIKGNPVAMEANEAWQYYRKHKSSYIGRTDATKYNEDSKKLRARVTQAKQQEPERKEEIDLNFRAGLKKIFEWEVERAKQDRTPPPNKDCIYDTTGQKISHLLR